MPTVFVRVRKIGISILLGAGLLLVAAQAQQNNTPQRGFHPAGSYVLSELETINTRNGNLSFNLPLAALPAGRGAVSGGVGLTYNSKTWDSVVSIWKDAFNNSYTDNLLIVSPDGGWRYGLQFNLQLVNRLDQYDVYSVPPCTEANVLYRYKLKMTFPDGSSHEFRPLGQSDNNQDGYFQVTPDGQITSCYSTVLWTNETMKYYSTDGSFLRLEFQHDSDSNWMNNPWTLYLPDGGRITGGNSPQRIYDRNSHYVEIENITWNSYPATKITDQLNRSVIVQYTGTQDYIHRWGVDNQLIKQTVKWKYINLTKAYYPGQGTYQYAPGSLWVVEEIVLPDEAAPAQAGTLKYTFGYSNGAPAQGWGEVRSLTLPTGAQAVYQWELDGDDFIGWQDALKNRTIAKNLTFQREYDGTSTAVTETWTYNLNPGVSATITGPDGGVTSETFGSKELSASTTDPDGMRTEQLWQENYPAGLPYQYAAAVNPAVQTVFRSLKDAAGNYVKTAITNYSYDKNGNVTEIVSRVVEIDFQPWRIPDVKAPLRSCLQR